MIAQRLRRVPWLEVAVLLVAMGVLVAFALLRSKNDSANVKYDSFSTYDASAGGYRAWYEVLEREGVPVERFVLRPVYLDRSLDTLIRAEPLPLDPQRAPSARADAGDLADWVRHGGHLVYLGPPAAARPSDAAGLFGRPDTDLATLLRLPAGADRQRHRGLSLVAPFLRSAGVQAVPFAVGPRWRISRRGISVLLDDGWGPIGVSYAFGRGRVTALSDQTLFSNGALGNGERARLAFALAWPRGGERVAFDEAVHGYAVPEHWWNIVPFPFALALALAGATLLLAFAGAAVRLGPPVVPRMRPDRSSSDFVDALANLLERGGARETALRDATVSTARARARSLGLPQEAALEEPAAERLDEARFVRGIALAQRLRKEYTPVARARH